MQARVGKAAKWKTPIWITINELKKKYDLPWIRGSMSYHRFPNLREIFNGDLNSKLNREIISRDYQNLPCNCRNRLTTTCDYNNMCRDKLIVYQVMDCFSHKSTSDPPNNTSKQECNNISNKQEPT